MSTINRTGVRYEVACDAIGAVISHYAEVIGMERSKPAPDAPTIEAGEAELKKLRDRREALDSRDASAIEAAIEEFGPQARALFQQT